MDLFLAFTAFMLILLAELGDKTQLTVITLSCRFPSVQVFIGSLLGIFVVDGLSVVFGASITALVPMTWIMLTSGCIFIVFGVLTLKSKSDEVKIVEKYRLPLVTSFYMMAFGELGDKTQIASIALAAEMGWESAFIGVISAFVVLIALSVVVGAKVISRFPKRWLTFGSAAFFIIVGILSILNVFLGVELI